MRIEKDGEVTHSITQLIHLSRNPSFSIIPFRNGHSILSYAFLMSSFNASDPFFPFFRVCMAWRVSYANRTLPVMSLPGTKALWVGEITERRIYFKRLAKTLEIILYITLQRLIGWKSDIFSGCLTFGINTIFV